MSGKARKIPIDKLSADHDIWHKPAEKALTEIIREKEAVFRASLSHYQHSRDDPKALHTMRVDLRRLRTWVKLAGDQVQTRKPARRQLKALGKASNPLRDHQVLLGWLELAREQLGEIDGLGNLIAYGRQNCAEAPKLHLSDKSKLKPKRKGNSGKTLRQWLTLTAAARVEHIDQLLRAEIGDVHEARIEIKQLRYLLEPFASQLEPARAMVKWCRQLQDLLGDMHDIQVLRSRLAELGSWVLEQEMPEATFASGKQRKAITRVFANAREPIIALAGWQSEELQRQWRNWLDQREQQLDALQEHRAALLQATA